MLPFKSSTLGGDLYENLEPKKLNTCAIILLCTVTAAPAPAKYSAAQVVYRSPEGPPGANSGLLCQNTSTTVNGAVARTSRSFYLANSFRTSGNNARGSVGLCGHRLRALEQEVTDPRDHASIGAAGAARAVRVDAGRPFGRAVGGDAAVVLVLVLVPGLAAAVAAAAAAAIAVVAELRVSHDGSRSDTARAFRGGGVRCRWSTIVADITAAVARRFAHCRFLRVASRHRRVRRLLLRF